MNRRLIAVAFVSLLAFGCSNGKGAGNGAVAGEAAPTTVAINYNMTEEKRLQEAVENGGQTWRNNAVDVANAALVSRGVNARMEECAIMEENDKHATVRADCKDGQFEVHLERLVKPGGIWTVTSVVVKSYKGIGSVNAGQEGHAHHADGHN